MPVNLLCRPYTPDPFKGAPLKLIGAGPLIGACAYDPDTWRMRLYPGCAYMRGKGVRRTISSLKKPKN